MPAGLRVAFKGVVYNTIQQACNAAGVDVTAYTRWCAKNTQEPTTSLDTYVSWRAEREAVFDGVTYPSARAACDAAGVPLSSVNSWCRRRGLSVNDSIDAYVAANPRTLFQGIKYATITEACRVAKVNRHVYGEWCARHGKDIYTSLDIYVTCQKPVAAPKPTMFNGVVYSSVKAACDAADVSVHGYSGWCQREHRDAYDGLDDYVKIVQRGIQWSHEEAELVEARYPYVGVNVNILLPGRTKEAVRTYAAKVGIHSADSHPSDKGSGLIGFNCPKCGAYLIMPKDTWVRDFIHGPMCEEYLWEECGDGE